MAGATADVFCRISLKSEHVGRAQSANAADWWLVLHRWCCCSSLPRARPRSGSRRRSRGRCRVGRRSTISNAVADVRPPMRWPTCVNNGNYPQEAISAVGWTLRGDPHCSLHDRNRRRRVLARGGTVLGTAVIPGLRTHRGGGRPGSDPAQAKPMIGRQDLQATYLCVGLARERNAYVQ